MTNDWLWWRDGAIYQIYPRSFADSNSDGIGDLIGIDGKLDYLYELGIDAIWLSPIFPSPDIDFGYDVSDYRDINPLYGTMDDFDRLLAHAHHIGIKIILDMVLNHTSDQHPWFLESRKDRNNPFSNWYIWKDPKANGEPPNNWQSIFGGGGWEYIPEREQYYYHMFYKEQPDLNWRNPEVRDAIFEILRFWLEKGVDGFRLDVFNNYYKDPNLKDNPTKLALRAFERQVHIYDSNQPEMISVVRDIRQLLDRYPQRYAVGEPFLLTPEQAAGYCQADGLTAVFDFNFLKCHWKPSDFLRAITRWDRAVSEDTYPTYVMNNHDNPRSATRYHAQQDDRLLKVAAALLFTQRGTPFLYYGEEIGMRDIVLRKKDIKDKVGEKYFPFYKGRDGCRALMQWNQEKFSGFSTKEPWLRVHSNYKERNVEVQRKNNSSLYYFYHQLMKLRKQLPVLRDGKFQHIAGLPKSVLAYTRKKDDQIAMIILNFSKRNQDFHLPPETADKHWDLILSTHQDHARNINERTFHVNGYEASIFTGKDRH